jgi:hypothetical protein
MQYSQRPKVLSTNYELALLLSLFLYLLFVAVFGLTRIDMPEHTAKAQSFLFPPPDNNNNDQTGLTATNKSAPPLSSNNGFIKYENPAYNMTIQYPANWKKTEVTSNNGSSNGVGGELASFHPQTSSSQQGTVAADSNKTINSEPNQIMEGLSIRAQPLQPASSTGTTTTATSVEQIINGAIDTFKKSLTNFQLIDMIPIAIGNGSLPAERIVYTYTEPSVEGEIPVKVMDIGTLKDNILYVISYTAKPINYLNYLPTIQKMIDSFSIISNANVNIPSSAPQAITQTAPPSPASSQAPASSPAPVVQQHHSSDSGGNVGSVGSGGGGGSSSTHHRGHHSSDSGGNSGGGDSGGGSGPVVPSFRPEHDTGSSSGGAKPPG